MLSYILVFIGLAVILIGVLLIGVSFVLRGKIRRNLISPDTGKRSYNKYSENLGIIVIGPIPIIIRSSSMKLFIVVIVMAFLIFVISSLYLFYISS